MPIVRPFTGLVYRPEAAGSLESVTAPPYDAISPVDQDRYYEASPFNIVRLILGKAEEGDDRTTNKYTRAASLLRSWRARGILVPAEEPCLYPYEVEFRFGGDRRTARGTLGAECQSDGRTRGRACEAACRSLYAGRCRCGFPP